MPEIKIRSREEVEAYVRSKLKKRKLIRIEAFKQQVDSIIKGSLVTTLEKKIKEKKKYAANKLHVKESQIRITTDGGWRLQFVFYANIPETEAAFEKRIKIAVDQEVDRIRKHKAEITRQEALRKKKKRDAAIEAIKELGDEIYDVFEEITKNAK